MPRIYTSRSEPIDFCKRCFPKSEADARDRYACMGDGPDGRGNCFDYEAEHPPYGDLEMEYRCYDCRKQLTSKDD